MDIVTRESDSQIETLTHLMNNMVTSMNVLSDALTRWEEQKERAGQKTTASCSNTNDATEDMFSNDISTSTNIY